MEQGCETSCETECKCGHQGCECGAQSQCCTCEDDKMAMMMCLAKSAKMELIKEKVKKKLEAAEGKKLDKVADLLVESMMDYHKAKAEIGKRKQGTRERFEAIFMEG